MDRESRTVSMERNGQQTEQGRKGKFIALEGIDGSGKSTQLRLLADRLEKENVDYHMTMEPTEAPIGAMLRQILRGKMKADNRVIAALFAADRLDHLLNEENGIAAKVENGTTVITDRYYFSSYAYHSVDMPMEWVIQVNEQSARILRPTVTVFIDVDPDTAMERILRNREQQELYEKRSRLEAVRKKYLEAFDRLKEVERVVLVDGNGSLEQTAEAVWKEVAGFL